MDNHGEIINLEGLRKRMSEISIRNYYGEATAEEMAELEDLKHIEVEWRDPSRFNQLPTKRPGRPPSTEFKCPHCGALGTMTKLTQHHFSRCKSLIKKGAG